ncbi:hypothetical protein [Streptomyces sp. SAJ15]|uniref:hypothetical protein n=1 Tax=Streptomyces sp. SAJ15 TaxID=2011095 RepID=UPI0011856F03|nr:hypothetical protein [Streptomyces sp. SAJ15]TVL92262.1 hypothetical protein CD790_11115 [Streptomyces sp. SAJ15]
MSQRPRLLPWNGPDGKPCYLVGDGTGHLWRLADELETVQLAAGAQLLGTADEMLRDAKTDARALHFLGDCLTVALRNALRVAESRGDRLPIPVYDDGEGDGPAEWRRAARRRFGIG